MENNANFTQKRILVYGQIPPPYHGTNVMSEFLLRALVNLGYNAKLTEKVFSKEIEEVNKITFIKLFRFFSTLFRFTKNILIFRPNLIIFFISATKVGLIAEFIFQFLSRIFHIPYVLYLHSKGYMNIYSESSIWRMIIPAIFRPVAACFILGDILKEDIKYFYAGKIYILPNCYNNFQAREQEKVAGSSIKILFLSNLTEKKGLFTLIKSISEVISELKNVRFIIAGPWQDDYLKEKTSILVNQNRLQGFISFLGPIHGKEKDDLFFSSDIFVFPTNYPFETGGLVSLEAMRAGLPVITTSIGALPEIVIDGETGFIIPPENPVILAEKIKLLISNSDLRKQMGIKGQQRFNNYYSFTAYTKNLRNIMDEVFIEK